MSYFIYKAFEWLSAFVRGIFFLFVTTLWIVVPLALLFGLVKGCDSLPYFVERQKQVDIQRKKEETPHVIREVDGCKVYAFKVNQHYHYFTRCPKDTTTDTTIEERHNKHTEQRIDQIVTENY